MRRRHQTSVGSSTMQRTHTSQGKLLMLLLCSLGTLLACFEKNCCSTHKESNGFHLLLACLLFLSCPLLACLECIPSQTSAGMNAHSHITGGPLSTLTSEHQVIPSRVHPGHTVMSCSCAGVRCAAGGVKPTIKHRGAHHLPTLDSQSAAPQPACHTHRPPGQQLQLQLAVTCPELHVNI